MFFNNKDGSTAVLAIKVRQLDPWTLYGMKAYLLKESLERLWTTAMKEPCCATCRVGSINCDGNGWYRFKTSPTCCWITYDGILNYCRTKGRFGVVEAINIKTLLRRGRGYKNLDYLLLKAQRMAVTKTEFIVLQKAG